MGVNRFVQPFEAGGWWTGCRFHRNLSLYFFSLLVTVPLSSVWLLFFIQLSCHCLKRRGGGWKKWKTENDVLIINVGNNNSAPEDESDTSKKFPSFFPLSPQNYYSSNSLWWCSLDHVRSVSLLCACIQNVYTPYPRIVSKQKRKCETSSISFFFLFWSVREMIGRWHSIFLFFLMTRKKSFFPVKLLKQLPNKQSERRVEHRYKMFCYCIYARVPFFFWACCIYTKWAIYSFYIVYKYRREKD